MPLSPPAARTALHHRRLDFHGYERADGLFDIECVLLDTKGMDVPLLGTGRVVPAGEPMHRMAIRMRVNSRLEVVDIEAASDATPYDVCPEATAALQAVVGLTVAAGWTEMVKRRLGGAKGCTHLMEMLVAMGTAAYQTVVPQTRMKGEEVAAFSIEKKANTCYAYAAERPLMQSLLARAGKSRA
jgi:Protein of unknown function (DUF2889)